MVVTAPDDCKIFTPDALANAMARQLPNRMNDRWLEPCVGRGAFLRALNAAGVKSSQITAIELDCHDGMSGCCGEYQAGVDFLDWSHRRKDKFERIIGNPPYISLHRVPPRVREAALQTPRIGDGNVPSKANCWYAFICASLRLLNSGGGLCFVLPSSWEYADYAADLREQMPNMFATFEVFRSPKSFFKGVLDGCVVVVADGFRATNRMVRRYDFSTPDELIQTLASRPRGITRDSRPRCDIPHLIREPNSLVRFGDIARVRIGAVTGSSAYFLLTESQRTDLMLPLSEVRPVVTRARHLTASSIRRDQWTRLRDSSERIWLFWPSLRSGRRCKAVAEYLKKGEEEQIHLRQKARIRYPWFRTRLIEHADGFISGMTPLGPWICLNRMRGLTATNTLYSVHFPTPFTRGQKAAWSLALVSATTAAEHTLIGRRYSDGLLKFEPKDIMNLAVPRPTKVSEEAVLVYSRVIESLLEGKDEFARRLADSFVVGKRKTIRFGT